MISIILNWMLHPFKSYADWKWKKEKKEFYTKKGRIESNKFHREAKRIR